MTKNKKTLSKPMAKKVRSIVKKEIQKEVEHKYIASVIDTESGINNTGLGDYRRKNNQFTGLNADDIAVRRCLNMCTKGTGVDQRIGDAIAPNFIDFDIDIRPTKSLVGATGMTGATGGYPTEVRYCIVRDNEPHGNTPNLWGNNLTSLPIFDDLSGSTAGIPFVGMKRYTPGQTRYKIILDKKIIIQPESYNNSVSPVFQLSDGYRKSHRIKLKGHKSTYSTNAGNATDIQKGSYWLFVFANDNFFVNYNVKLFYTDI